jgi:hypothetical protein
MGSLHPGRGLAAGVDRGLNTVAGCPDMAGLTHSPATLSHRIAVIPGGLILDRALVLARADGSAWRALAQVRALWGTAAAKRKIPGKTAGRERVFKQLTVRLTWR